MANQHKSIANVQLRTDRTTKLKFNDLHTWVIWQFPRPQKDNFCGAVRPPIPDHTWFPALINGNKEQAIVHAHLETEFDTPEAAADWLADPKNRGD